MIPNRVASPYRCGWRSAHSPDPFQRDFGGGIKLRPSVQPSRQNFRQSLQEARFWDRLTLLSSARFDLNRQTSRERIIIMDTNEGSTERLTTDLKRLVHDSEELLHDSAGAIGEKAHALRERLSKAVEAAKAACRNLEEKAIEGAKATDKVIREHPYESVGVAFGIGLLIGVLVARK